MKDTIYALLIMLSCMTWACYGMDKIINSSKILGKRFAILMFALGAAWLVLSITLIAYGQSPPDALLRQAYELRRAGHDEEALPLLEQAYASDHSPRVAAQLGLCNQALGQWTPAQEHLREALAAPADTWVARNLAALEGAYTLVSSYVPTSLTPTSVISTGVREPSPVSRPPESRNPAPHRTTQPVTHPIPPVPAITALSIAGTLELVGITSLIARQDGIDAYNTRVAQGLPCDRAAAVTARDAETGVAIAGISAGAVALVMGGVMLATQHQAQRVAWACAPGVGGAACTVRF